jgi:hypothetical protein
MLMRILFIVSLSTATAAVAEDKLSVNLGGIGSKTCGYWLSGKGQKLEGTVWIYGFWSGLNYVAAASDQDQSRATSADMVDAVEKACKREPSRILASAAWSAYVDLNKN